jgi:hypothetical protein
MPEYAHCMNPGCEYHRASAVSTDKQKGYDPASSTAREFPRFFCSQRCQYDFLANQLQVKLCEDQAFSKTVGK